MREALRNETIVARNIQYIYSTGWLLFFTDYTQKKFNENQSLNIIKRINYWNHLCKK